jgi:methionyl-tRNA formyltransferase
MRLAFMGTPDFAVPTLDALIVAGHEVAAVYCQPPRPAGRGKGVRPSPIQRAAEAAGLEVRTPLSLRDETAQRAFAALNLDVAVVAAYGLILPMPILEAPRLGCLNVHASWLPRWRGAAPIQRAILAGDKKTGVTIMQMERGLDTGPILAQGATSLDMKTAGELTIELADLGASLIQRVLEDISRYPPAPQPEEGVTYAPKIEKSEARLDFMQSAVLVERQVRAFNPVPGAYFELNGERIRVLAAEIVPGGGPPGMVADDNLKIACGERAIRALLVQRAGRNPMSVAEFLRGFPISRGTQLS